MASGTADGGAAARKSIYKTAAIMAGLTLVEFVIAGTKSYYPGWTGLSEGTIYAMVVALFIILTIFKAFYIVAEFMHLGSEVKRLAWSILIPFIFVVWLIISQIWEASY
ncbi:MAG: cytochrome C oxidase subunit IV family protein [Bacteroidota bacterium]